MSFNNHDSKDVKLVRVFKGGDNAEQLLPFLRAVANKYKLLFFKIEYIDTNLVRTFKWSPCDLIDWFLSADCYVILTHIHQNIPQWNICELRIQLSRLFYHNGFPSGKLNNLLNTEALF